MGAVLSHAEKAKIRKPKIHLGRGFCVGRVLKDDPNAIDFEFNPRLINDLGWCDEAGGTQWQCLTKTIIDVSVRSGG